MCDQRCQDAVKQEQKYVSVTFKIKDANNVSSKRTFILKSKPETLSLIAVDLVQSLHDSPVEKKIIDNWEFVEKNGGNSVYKCN